MGILTISRELGSGGDAIGKKVAQELGWTLLDNDGFGGEADTAVSPGNATEPGFVQVRAAVEDPFTTGFYPGRDAGQGNELWLATILVTALNP